MRELVNDFASPAPCYRTDPGKSTNAAGKGPKHEFSLQKERASVRYSNGSPSEERESDRGYLTVTFTSAVVQQQTSPPPPKPE